MRRGITLIELLVAMGLSGVVVLGLVAAFGAAVNQQLTDGQKREEFEQSIGFEKRVRNLLSHAYLSGIPNDQNTYFLGRTMSGASSLGSNASDEVVFTAIGNGLPAGALNSTEVDFDARNEQFGPVGGPLEVAITMTPVGQGGDSTGVYLREQKPADSDPDQGGFEQVIDDRIEAVSFEFHDGVDWIGEWDSALEGGLPRAVRVSYTITDDPETVRSFVVRLTNEAPPAQQEEEGGGGP